MPETDLTPIAVGTYDEWVLGAGGSKVIAVDPPDDANATYIKFSATTGKKQTYLVDALPASAKVVVRVSCRIRGYRSVGVEYGFQHITVFDGNEALCGTNHRETSYTDFIYKDVARPDGGDWVPANFGNVAGRAEFGPRTVSGGADRTYRVTTVVVTVLHDVCNNFAMFLSQWLPPILAVASHSLLKSEIEHILSGFASRPRLDEDFARVFEALRRRPVYGYLGI